MTGESFVIPIFEIFERSGLSDLVVVMLKHPVEEHEDYGRGDPIQPIQLAKETPKAGEVSAILLSLWLMLMIVLILML